MRAYPLVILLLASSSFAAPEADAEKTYDLLVTPPASVKSGEKAALRIEIRPKAGAAAHVDEHAPLSAKMKASAGLHLVKAKFVHADAKATADKGAELAIAFEAVTAGAQEISGDVDFFVCTEQWCARQQKKITAAVLVK